MGCLVPSTHIHTHVSALSRLSHKVVVGDGGESTRERAEERLSERAASGLLSCCEPYKVEGERCKEMHTFAPFLAMIR